jgi:hypothetical protein
VYFGLMLMSGLGSAIAWLAGCARTEDRVKRLKVLDRLLDIVQEARAAETVDELVKLRGEADGVLSRTIRQVEASKLDESALMAFSLALDQAQLAISDRRSTLAALANSPTGLGRASSSTACARCYEPNSPSTRICESSCSAPERHVLSRRRPSTTP